MQWEPPERGRQDSAGCRTGRHSVGREALWRGEYCVRAETWAWVKAQHSRFW